MFVEPPRTDYDVQLTVLGVPVRIHPLFWGVTLVLGAVGSAGQPVAIGIWVAAVFVSILVHELGHALIARRFGWPPRIALYGMGGLAIYSPTRQTTASRVAIAVAGPLAGFGVGGIIAAGLVVSGHALSLPPFGQLVHGAPLSGRLGLFVHDLMFINVFWGLINLAPIQPLDGGHAVAALLERADPRGGQRTSYFVSMIAACALGVAGLIAFNSTFIAVMFGLLAFQSWSIYSQLSPAGRA